MRPDREVFIRRMAHGHPSIWRSRCEVEFLPEDLVTFRFDANGEDNGFTTDLLNPHFHFSDLDFTKLADGFCV